MLRSMGLMLALCGFVLMPLTGCQSGQIFYQPGVVRTESQRVHDFILAADFVQSSGPSTPPTEGGDSKAVAEEPGDDEDASKDDSAPPGPAYTVPATQYQQLALLSLGIAAFGGGEFDEIGKEASESSINSLPVVSRPGLSAPPPRANSTVVGRPGLQQGFAAGLGLSSGRSIFTARPNPASGAMGRCQDLVRAGFFGGDRTACEASFRR